MTIKVLSARGSTRSEIARLLGVTEGAVRYHAKRMASGVVDGRTRQRPKAEAVAQLTNGLEVLAGLPGGPERQRRELGLQFALGQASIAAKGYAAPETGRAYARACELCRGAGGTPELFPALYGQSVVHWQRGELAAAHGVARELLRVAEERGDAAAEVVGHRILGAFLFQLGRLAESRAHSESALALYDPVRDRSSRFVYAVDSRVVGLFYLSHVLLTLGYPEQARVRQGETLAAARELAHPNTIAQALFWVCTLHQLLRDRRGAREQAEPLIALATEQGLPLWAAAGVVVRGWALAERRAHAGRHRGDPPGLGRLPGHGGRAFLALLPRPARRSPRAGGPGRHRPEPPG